MTSFSVKKPFTVFVAVVAILVFGVMSYVKMTPDLMPNMDYPYVVVVTTYPGAAPEEVEAVVTKPMEQSMATLNDIKTVTSTSAENYSMLVLEFEQSTNMDSAVVDILQKTQMLTGRWDDSIGTPSIIRINPNMIPVMVAAVDSSEMAFKIAASMAFREAAKKAKPVLLEPIMKVEVTVPEDYMGDVIGDVTSRRGNIAGLTQRNGAQQIDCFVPLSEMFGYATNLRSRTQGRGQFTMEPSHYVELSKNLADAVISKRKGY